jgi:hypothetical protein
MIGASTIANSAFAGAINYANVENVEFDLLGGNDTLTQTAQPGAAVTFKGGTGNDTLNVNAGSFAFAGDAGAASASLTVNVANAGSTVNFSGAQHLAALNLSNGGTAVLAASASAAAAVVMNIGAVSFTGSGSSLDLANNELLTSTSAAIVQAQLAAGQLWTSTPSGALGSMALGSGQTEVRYTMAGDANLDGAIDVADLGALATNYGLTAGAAWNQGDFNHDGAVNVGDLGALATNYGASLGFTSATATPAAVVSTAASISTVVAPNSRSMFSETPLSDSQPDQTLDSIDLKMLREHRRRVRDTFGGSQLTRAGLLSQ